MDGLSFLRNRPIDLRWGAGRAILALVAAVLVAGAAGAAAADVAIGGVGPLSQPGDVAGGTEMKWAMEQAVADLNAKGGVLGQQLRLIFYDTQNKPDVCAAI